MTKRTRTNLSVAAAIFTVAALVTFLQKHQQSPVPQGAKASVQRLDAAGTDTEHVARISGALRTAGIDTTGLNIRYVDGIALVGGNTSSRTDVAQINNLVKNLGYDRFANLVQVKEGISDQSIVRNAERQLTMQHNFEGCKFAVACQSGVLTVKGTVVRDVQKDAVRAAVKNIAGVKSVRTELVRL
jgi:osmotically-inducible protein OsmY